MKESENGKAKPIYRGRNGKLLLKVPTEVMLDQADKLIAKLRQKLGENESYIQELEERCRKAESMMPSKDMIEQLKELRAEVKRLRQDVNVRNGIIKKYKTGEHTSEKYLQMRSEISRADMQKIYWRDQYFSLKCMMEKPQADKPE